VPGITGFGFKRIEEFSADWLLAATAGVRFLSITLATSRTDKPPRNLPQIASVVLNFTFRYD